MSNLPPLPGNSPSAGGGDLQFDKVEYASAESSGGPAPCAACNRPIDDIYYEVNGQIMCPDCKTQLHGAVTGGSKTMRMLRAFFFGFVAMVSSSVAYYYLRKMTDAEFAIATIAMGWLIGWAVHRGARGRGGWFYQCAAVFLTYSAIAFSYTGMAFDQLAKMKPDQEITPGKSSSGILNSTTATATAAQPDDNKEETITAPGLTEDAKPSLKSLGGTEIAVAFVVIVGLLLALPVLAVFEAPLLFLIYGFGLWQAAKMNVRPKIVVAGPYSTRGGVATIGSTGPSGDKQII